MASIVIRKGKYCVSYRIEDESGRKRQRWETFETKADAVARKQEIEHGFTTIPLEITSIKTVSDMMHE